MPAKGILAGLICHAYTVVKLPLKLFATLKRFSEI